MYLLKITTDKGLKWASVKFESMNELEAFLVEAKKARDWNNAYTVEKLDLTAEIAAEETKRSAKQSAIAKIESVCSLTTAEKTALFG